MTMLWISVEDEAPPEDGFYYVTQDPDNPIDAHYVKYDGYGFYDEGPYMSGIYWRKNTSKRQKVYGTQKKESL